MIMRGKDVEHHNVVNDMMMSEEVTYRPQPGADGVPKNTDVIIARLNVLLLLLLQLANV